MPAYIYRQTETNPNLYTVGHYDPEGNWEPESDHSKSEDAAARVRYLNGGTTESQADSHEAAPGLDHTASARGYTYKSRVLFNAALDAPRSEQPGTLTQSAHALHMATAHAAVAQAQALERIATALEKLLVTPKLLANTDADDDDAGSWGEYKHFRDRNR